MLGFYRSLVPRIRELNVAPEEELDRFDDYVRLILAEVEEEGKTVLLEMNYNAWARKPE